jgi:hypothetical protein
MQAMDASLDSSGPVDIGRLGGAACSGIDYPAKGFYGDNILAPNLNSVGFAPMGTVEVAAKLGPSASLQVQLTHIQGSRWSAQFDQFRVKEVATDPHTQLLEAKFAGQMNETTMFFFGGGRMRIDYFECGSTTPSGTKFLSWGNGVDEGGAP